MVTKGETHSDQIERAKNIFKKIFLSKIFSPKIFSPKIFSSKIFSPKMFLSKIFLKKYTNYFLCFVKNISKKIFHHKYFRKNIFTKNISEKTLLTTIFLKKGGGEAPLLPAGPRLISSDSEISA